MTIQGTNLNNLIGDIYLFIAPKIKPMMLV
jgi:hypothetical protein